MLSSNDWILYRGDGGCGPLRRFTHAKSDMPSGFSMKLRKHIRTQRLEDVRQVGMDRVVDFKFGSGEASNHVILELYASGTAWNRSCAHTGYIILS